MTRSHSLPLIIVYAAFLSLSLPLPLPLSGSICLSLCLNFDLSFGLSSSPESHFAVPTHFFDRLFFMFLFFSSLSHSMNHWHFLPFHSSLGRSLPLFVPPSFSVPDGFPNYTTISLCPERLYNHLCLFVPNGCTTTISLCAERLYNNLCLFVPNGPSEQVCSNATLQRYTAVHYSKLVQ